MSLQDIKNMKLPGATGGKMISDDLIGPSRPGQLKQSSNAQPVFKNVEAGDVVVKSDLGKQKSLQSRGLGLGPMQMRK
jgi:hypothetical protein